MRAFVTSGVGPVLVAALFASSVASAEIIDGESPRSGMLEFKLGGVTPRISSEEALGDNDPYADTFDGSMLLFELEVEKQLFQSFGSFAVGVSAGYAEKYGRAQLADGTEAEESTGFRMIPLRLLGVYRFDYFARTANFPIVPYGKLGLVYTPWWMLKGGSTEVVNGRKASGGKSGYAAVVGISILLDFFDRRLARDFDNSLGVNHSYLFAEYMHEDVNNFGGPGLDLSSRHFMFGLALEY